MAEVPKKNIYKGPLDNDGVPVGFSLIEEKEDLPSFVYTGEQDEVPKLADNPLLTEEEEPEMITVFRGNTPYQVIKSEYFKGIKEDAQAFTNFGTDLKKTAYKLPRGLIDIVTPEDPTLSPKGREQKINLLTDKAIQQAFPILKLADWKDTNIIDERTGRVKPIETKAGTVVDIGAIILVGSKARTAAMAVPKISSAVATILGGEVAAHLMIDPEDGIAKVLEDMIPKESKGYKKYVRASAEFMSADPEDTEVTKRLKMTLENLGFTALLTTAIKSPSIAKFMVGKHPSQMSKAEQEAIVMKAFEEERMILRMQNPDKLALIKETDEGKEQVKKQESSYLKRMQQKYFFSRGYSTPLLFHAANNAKYQQKQLITAAQNIGDRLDTALKRIDANPKFTGKVEKLLEADLTRVFKMDPDKQVSFFAKQRNIPKDVAAEILNFRRVQDTLSSRMLKMKGFSSEAREAIDNNLRSYIRRSYRAYEDPGYKPTPEVRAKALSHIADGLEEVALAEGKILSREAAEVAAEKKIVKMLTLNTELMDYTAQMNRVGSLKQKKDITPEIRALLGEVTNPSEKIIISIAKTARIAELQQYYNVVNQLSKGKNGYIQTAKNEAKGYNVQITGTNSILDNKWTTPQVRDAVMNKEETFDFLETGTNFGSVAWRGWVAAKGTSQMMKTVYSHTTQFRNVVGAANFMVANGRTGLSVHSLESMKIIENKVFGARAKIGTKTGLYNVDEKAMTDLYEEYLGLGLINTSVNVNQFREMLATGFQGSDSIYKAIGAGDSALKRNTKKAIKKPEDIYMATDDFHKIAYYNEELSTLQKAFPKVDDTLLKQRAASIVKNTMPNYDMIPKGIKQLRNMPFGNFISFPAEIARTSYNIVKQAADEIASPNAVIKRRGQARLVGFATANIGYGKLAQLSHDEYNMTNQQVEDRRLLKAGPFSSGHDLVYRMDDDGNYYTLNTQYLNSYYFIKEPVMAAWDRILNGELRGEELDKVLLESVVQGAKALTDPFTDEAMIVKPVVDLLVAASSKDGRDRKDRQLFPAKDSAGDNFQTVLKETLTPFTPGSVMSGLKLKDAVEGKTHKYKGTTRDPGYELLAQFGFKMDMYREDDYLKYAATTYTDQNDQNRLDSVNFESTGKNIEEDYFKVNAVEYQFQQDLYIKTSAYERLFGWQRAYTVLIDNGISDEKAQRILNGQFLPTLVPQDLAKFRKKDSRQLTDEKLKTFNQEIREGAGLLIKARNSMDFMPLSNPGDFEFKSETEKQREKTFASPIGPSKKYERLSSSLNENTPTINFLNEDDWDSKLTPLATGGEVFEPVPNAPLEPDERINKLTGLPYNEGAGPAYMDTDDPMRVLNMAAGGRVKKDLGGLLSKASSFIGDTIRDAVPTNIRQLAHDVTGGTEDLTENNLQEDEKKALIDAVNLAKKEGRTAIEYGDYATHKKGQSQYRDVGGGGGPRAFISKLSNPAYSMKTTLGQASFKEDAEGNTIITDQYNFNDSTGEPSLLRFIGGVKNAGPSLYGQARNVAREFGSQEGEGSEVTINLGNLSSLNTDNKGPV